MKDLQFIPEPLLSFAHGQRTEDPRDGLMLFGPLDAGKPYGIRTGVIGTERGIACYQRWVQRIQGPISTIPPQLGRPPFPGFETIFRIPWAAPILQLVVTDEEIDGHLYLDDPHLRVFGVVSAYSERLLQALREEEQKPDLWFVVVPDRLWKYCRPKSIVEPTLRQKALKSFATPGSARSFYRQGSLFEEMRRDATPYVYEEQFHNQLKARLLERMVLTQVVKESTIANADDLDELAQQKQRRRESEIAWNLSTAAFYKVGGRPWKAGNIRDGVCYVGLVFKKDSVGATAKNACCAAQMFLDSGDGVVFKGAVGPWYSEETGDFHLDYRAARNVADLAITSYEKRTGHPPQEVFIHGKTWFNNEEWCGFEAAAGKTSKVVGIRIRNERDLKLYRKGQNPVLRGIAAIRDDRSAFLWTRGWTPRLQTYPGREVPNPLAIDICRGEADIRTVLTDIMALTKLNYNTCIFGDGFPITLRFADAVGEILTAGPIKTPPPLPFSHYI